MTHCTVIVALLTGLGVSTPARATPVTSPVLCDAGQIGTVTATEYLPFYTAGPLGRDPQKRPGIEHGPDRIAADLGGGARFQAFFDFTGCPGETELRPDTEFRWVQIVYTNSPSNDAIRGVAPATGYVDPWSPPGGGAGYEDEKPFYWTDAEWQNVGVGGDFPHTQKLLFFDYSRRSFTDNGVNWRAELNLVCTWDHEIHALGYFDWGWTMPANSLTDKTQAITLNPAAAAWHNGASPGLPKLELAAEFGGFGWELTDEPCCTDVPAPEPLAPLLLALAGLVLAIRHPSRRHAL